MQGLFSRLSPFILVLAALQTQAASLEAEVDAVIPALMQEQRIPGMAVAVFANGQAHYFSYGLADKAQNTPVTRDTLFEVGSVSKTYTATLAALASVEGKLDLAAPAERYEPALAGAPLGKASVLDLGAYSADCLPLQFPDAVTDEQQALAYLRQWKPRFAPGTQRCYSNPSLGLFGHLAARAQQQPFGQLMTQQLFKPMGLAHTYLEVPPQARALYAQGYDANDRPVRVNPGPFAEQAYGVKTSASDLLRYVRWQLDPSGLMPAQARAIALTHAGYFQAGPLTQSLGWERYPLPVTLDSLLQGNDARMIREPQATQRLTPALPARADAWYNKTGATNGFGAYVAFIPAKGLGIVLLANRNYPNDARVRAAYRILTGLEKGLSDNM